MSSEATLQLLYYSPYVRIAGRVCGGARPPEVAFPAPLSAKGPRRATQSPFTAPPPAAVTTTSYAELLKSRTRPQRYGPAEIFSAPVTEAQVAGFKVAQGSKAL